MVSCNRFFLRISQLHFYIKYFPDHIYPTACNARLPADIRVDTFEDVSLLHLPFLGQHFKRRPYPVVPSALCATARSFQVSSFRATAFAHSKILRHIQLSNSSSTYLCKTEAMLFNRAEFEKKNGSCTAVRRCLGQHPRSQQAIPTSLVV